MSAVIRLSAPAVRYLSGLLQQAARSGGLEPERAGRYAAALAGQLPADPQTVRLGAGWSAELELDERDLEILLIHGNLYDTDDLGVPVGAELWVEAGRALGEASAFFRYLRED